MQSDVAESGEIQPRARWKVYASVAVVTLLVILGQYAVNRYWSWKTPELHLNGARLHRDNIFALPATNLLVLDLALEDREPVGPENLRMMLLVQTPYASHVVASDWQKSFTGNFTIFQPRDMTHSLATGRFERYVHRFPPIRIHSEELGILGLSLQCEAGGRGITESRVHLSFEPGRTNVSRSVDTVAQDFMRKHSTTYHDRMLYYAKRRPAEVSPDGK